MFQLKGMFRFRKEIYTSALYQKQKRQSPALNFILYPNIATIICQGKGTKLLLSKSCLGLNVGHRDFVLFVCDALLTFGATFATFTVPPGLDVCSCRLIESLFVEFGLHIFVFISWRVFSSSSLSS